MVPGALPTMFLIHILLTGSQTSDPGLSSDMPFPPQNHGFGLLADYIHQISTGKISFVPVPSTCAFYFPLLFDVVYVYLGFCCLSPPNLLGCMIAPIDFSPVFSASS